VNVSPRFLGRGSWLARRDPRILVIAIVAFSVAMIQLWDIRLVIPMLALAFGYYRLAGIRFADVRRNWIAAIILITFIVTLNTILTGDRVGDMGITDIHPYFQIPILGTTVSAESLMYAAAQWMRMFASLRTAKIRPATA